MPQWALVIVAAIGLRYAYKAFIAAKDQAGEAKRQADAVEKTLKVIHAPNVFCSKVEINHLRFGERPAIIVYFLNTGGSLATDVWLSAGLDFVVSSSVVAGLMRQGPFTIAPRQETFLTIAYPPTTITSDQIEGLNTGQLHLLVFGAIEFFDPINATLVKRKYHAKYIVFGPDWTDIQPRPKFPSDFWIHNDV
jgi:hypothetical protein